MVTHLEVVLNGRLAQLVHQLPLEEARLFQLRHLLLESLSFFLKFLHMRVALSVQAALFKVAIEQVLELFLAHRR